MLKTTQQQGWYLPDFVLHMPFQEKPSYSKIALH